MIQWEFRVRFNKTKVVRVLILVFDVGNSNIVLGVFEGDELVANWRISTKRERTADEYGIMLKDLFAIAQIDMSAVKDTVISTVVPPLTTILERACQKYLHHTPLIVGPGIKTGLPVICSVPVMITGGAASITTLVSLSLLFLNFNNVILIVSGIFRPSAVQFSSRDSPSFAK